ncbi:hypothetical protein PybrP1_004184, partial [[Pythium] brassicae (nom. inval.)]
VEIRALREQVQQLESTFAQLSEKWHVTIPDRVQRVAAFEAARQKWQTALVEARHKVLDEQLVAQMLYMSTLQSLLAQSPVYAMPSSLDVFNALHSPLHLRDLADEERIAQLGARDEMALRVAASLVDKFTASHLADVSGVVPFTRTGISADARFTYMSTVFIARIPRVSVSRAHAAVLGYCDSVYSELARRYNVVHEVKSSGVVAVDFVDRDDRFPDASDTSAARRDVTQMIYVSMTTDPVSKQPQVLLRRVCVDRFNLSPDTPLLRDEVQLAQAWSNGDLFMAL